MRVFAAASDSQLLIRTEPAGTSAVGKLERRDFGLHVERVKNLGS
jgi:hypothetical protein